MADSKPLVCPVCNGHDFLLKYEASYVYSYVIDADAPGLKNNAEFLPFLYDNREQTAAGQYLQCGGCHTKYPCYFNDWDGQISTKALQDAINAYRA